MAQKPVRASLGATVASHLQDAIVSGQLRLGEALSEDSIADALGVSRTPVRQALQLLETRGLVEIRPKAGTFVFEPTAEQIGELSEFRAALELRAAHWAFERARENSADQLGHVVDEMAQAIAKNDVRAYGRADTRFHEVFFDNSGNSFLRRAYEFSFPQVAALRTNLARYSEAEPHRSFADHQQLRDIFMRGSAGDIDAILEPHVLRTRDNYTTTLEELQQRQSGGRFDHLKKVLDGISLTDPV